MGPRPLPLPYKGGERLRVGDRRSGAPALLACYYRDARMRSGLGYHDLTSLMDIQALYRRLSVELPPVERVPRRASPHPCRGGVLAFLLWQASPVVAERQASFGRAGGGVSIYLTDAGALAAVSEVKVKRRKHRRLDFVRKDTFFQRLSQ